MKILVTGASGYIGRQLAEQLLAGGHEVTCLVRDAGRANLVSAERCRPNQIITLLLQRCDEYATKIADLDRVSAAAANTIR